MTSATSSTSNPVTTPIAPIAIQSERPVAVMGLGKSGLAAIQALRRGGTDVIAWDDSEDRRAVLDPDDVLCHPLTEDALASTCMMVLAPGIPLTHPAPHPVVTAARATNIEILGDVELLYRAAPGARYVGITGTNGKSTTTALIGHILQQNRPVQVGGNLGPPVLDFRKPSRDEPVILELSSYQLDLTRQAVMSIAVLMNITPDHLDRHGGMEGYIAAKERIFRRGALQQTAVIGVDTEITEQIADQLERAGHWQVIRISGENRVDGGIYALNGVLHDDLRGNAEALCDLQTVETLPGRHNRQNAAAAYAVCRKLSMTPAEIVAGIESFPGLPHRQEIVARFKRMTFVNDSKATNADAASKALGSYPAIYWIAGGRAKAGGLTGLEPLMNRIAHTFLIGEAAEPFAEWLDGKASATICGTLEAAVNQAAEMALTERKKAVILLSPACASFDQFTSFEARGDAFRSLASDWVAAREAALEVGS